MGYRLGLFPPGRKHRYKEGNRESGRTKVLTKSRPKNTGGVYWGGKEELNRGSPGPFVKRDFWKDLESSRSVGNFIHQKRGEKKGSVFTGDEGGYKKAPNSKKRDDREDCSCLS